MKNTTLIETLDTVNGCTFVGIDTETKVKLLGGKKNPMQGRVTKRTTGIKAFAFGNSGTNGYENMVNRRLVSEGKEANFQVGELPWGERLPDSPIIENKGAYYLQLVIDERARPTVEYFIDGNPIAKSDVEGLQGARKAENQGLENTVKIRTFKAESIVRIRAWGEEIA